MPRARKRLLRYESFVLYILSAQLRFIWLLDIVCRIRREGRPRAPTPLLRWRRGRWRRQRSGAAASSQ